MEGDLKPIPQDEGWQFSLTPGTRVAHYIRNSTSLCRRVGFYMSEVIPHITGNLRGNDDCAACLPDDRERTEARSEESLEGKSAMTQDDTALAELRSEAESLAKSEACVGRIPLVATAIVAVAQRYADKREGKAYAEIDRRALEVCRAVEAAIRSSPLTFDEAVGQVGRLGRERDRLTESVAKLHAALAESQARTDALLAWQRAITEKVPEPVLDEVARALHGPSENR